MKFQSVLVIDWFASRLIGSRFPAPARIFTQLSWTLCTWNCIDTHHNMVKWKSSINFAKTMALVDRGIGPCSWLGLFGPILIQKKNIEENFSCWKLPDLHFYYFDYFTISKLFRLCQRTHSGIRVFSLILLHTYLYHCHFIFFIALETSQSMAIPKVFQNENYYLV